MKSADTGKWTQEDITDVKRELPDRIEFNSISASHRSEIELDVGDSVLASEIEDLALAARQTLDDLGVPTDEIYVKAGYRGATNQALLLVVTMDESHTS